MNNLKLVLNPFEEINTASLNGNALSPYSELSNFIKEPFLYWAGLLPTAIDREINDDFSLTISCGQFEELLIRDLFYGFDSCKSVATETFELDFLIDKRYNVIRKLSDKYKIAYSTEKYKIPLYSDFLKIDDEEFLENAELTTAFIYVIKDESELKKIIENQNKNSIVIRISDENQVTFLQDGKYIWNICKSRLDEIIKSIVDRFAKIPFLAELYHSLMNCKYIDSSDKELAQLAVAISPFIKVKNINDIEVGQMQEVELSLVPENCALPNIRLESENTDIIETKGLKVKALSVGETYIYVYKADEIIPIAKRKVKTYRDNSVKQIFLDRSVPKMGIGRKQQIEISVLPKNADDADFIMWSVDNSNVATIDSNGLLTAKNSGRVIVTASTQRVKESVVIDVLPNISKMTLSEDDITIFKGETQNINLSYEPYNCFNNSYVWTTDDNNIAYVEQFPDGTSVLRANEPGKCVVTCVAEEGGCTVSCNIEVLDPVVEEQKRKDAEIRRQQNLLLTWLLVGILLFLLVSFLGSTLLEIFAK